MISMHSPMIVFIVLLLLVNNACIKAFSFNSHILKVSSSSSHSNSVLYLSSSPSPSSPVKRTDDKLSFGNRIDVNIKLPTRDRNLVLDFLGSPKNIVESVWDADKIKKISGSNDRYLLIMPTLPLLGIDNITPEIEIDFNYVNESIIMSSGNWTLRGTKGGIVKDSRFMQTFSISINGELNISPSSLLSLPSLLPSTLTTSYTPPLIETVGWVEYRVQGEKPTIFKKAPSFILESTIKIIKNSVAIFVEKIFVSRLVKSFRNFMLLKNRAQ